MARVVVTTTGAGSVVAPVGAYAVDVEAWGPGGSGNDESTTNACGGGGGAYAGCFNLAISAGTSIFWNVPLGGAASSFGAGFNGAGKTWINIGANSAPSVNTTGAQADFGLGATTSSVGVGGLVANSIGQIGHLFAGGSGFKATSSPYDAPGGGGAGSAGAGGNGAAGNSPGAGGTPDGGTGGTGASPSNPGAQPGGGGGAQASQTSGAGGAGQVAYTFYIAPAFRTDFPNPPIISGRVDLLSWLQAVPINLKGKDKFFGLAGAPQFDWPVPKGYVPGISLLTHMEPIKLNLIYKDKFFGAAGQPPANMDWPVPKGATPGISLLTHVEATKLNLTGTDKFFGLAGAPQFDWPVPKTAKGSVDLYNWQLSSGPNLIVAIVYPASFGAFDWPNPMQIGGSMAALAYTQANIILTTDRIHFLKFRGDMGALMTH
jgi:hypothetical protein